MVCARITTKTYPQRTVCVCGSVYIRHVEIVHAAHRQLRWNVAASAIGNGDRI